MKTPKVLPWLARKHGVSEERAELLWASALRYATVKTGWVGTSDYWRAAMERFVALLEKEAQVRPAPFAAWMRIQSRFWLLPLVAAHRMSIAAVQVCKSTCAVQRGAVPQ